VHVVNDDEQTIELVAWSRRTLEHYCHAVSDTHYPVAQAGIWADALRQRQPVVFNDYEQYPHKRGLPEGHAVLHRLISVPVIDKGQVVMLTGVGNKATDYTDLDVETIQLLSNEMWRIVRVRRTVSALQTLNQHLEQRVAERTRELSEQVQQRELSELRYREVVSKMGEGVAICEVVDDGEDFILREFNPAAERICDRAWKQVAGRRLSITFPGLQESGLKEIFRQVWKSGESRYLPEQNYQDDRLGIVVELYVFRLLAHELVMVFHDIRDRKRTEEQLEHIAYYDTLTGLPNRALLVERLSQAMTQTVRRQQKLAVVYIDLDGFKSINDSFGHQIGDQLLGALSRRMQYSLRQKDTIARIGGDEFMAVLLDVKQANLDDLIQNRLLTAASKPIQIEDMVIRISASLGVSLYPQENLVSADQLMQQADLAMYQAKTAGKNRCFFFNPISQSDEP
jgi:diguanylate cyclase (GGDEF)-like protein